MENQSKAIEIYEGELWQATMLKNILEDNNIQAFLQDEFLGVIAPFIVQPGGSNAVKVFVSSENFSLAGKLVADFNNSKPS